MIATKDLQDSPENVEALRRAVLGGGPWEVASDDETATIVPGEVHGEITGGNLDLLSLSTGSHPSVIGRAEGKIVLMEEIHESPYRLDRLLQLLLRSGYFDGAIGIGLGTWVDWGPLPEIRALMEETLSPLGVPVIWGLRFGHGARVSSFPIGHGITATLRADDKPALVLDQPAG
jgi:muramoyltetrapeptide carboxypeptidase